MARAAEGKPALEPDKPAELPLTREELAVMRQHLKFLREHRKVLHLRTNAHEDLLLNDVRQPTTRGVCQHLLAKVDRSRVFGAVERLDPASATRLAEGVLRIAPDVDYLLLYLSCVRRSASQTQAVAALAEALERIDFTQVSSGHMRRVLDLVVELFDERQRAQVLFGLLDRAAFRQAFEQSASELPEVLAELVVPLGAVQAVVLHDRPNRHGPAMLERGVKLLLSGDERAVLRYPPGARRRLAMLGIASGAAADPGCIRPLHALLESLRESVAEYQQLALDLVQRWMTLGQEKDARRLLASLLRDFPDLRSASRWLEALDAPRVDRIALVGSKRPGRRGDKSGAEAAPEQPGTEPPRAASRLLGVCLRTLRPLTVVFAQAPTDEAHASLAALVRSLGLPGVAPLVHEGTDGDGRPFFAILRQGQRLTTLLERRGGPSTTEALGVCAQAAALLGMLAQSGVRLPDASALRFEVDDAGQLWLADVRGAVPATQPESERAHLELVRGLCRSVLAGPKVLLPPEDLLQSLDRAQSTAEVRRLLVAHG
ncbi:MAG: hypothetical protein JW940_10340 [Polyangiaceae bacterium]|nr:hypothetical protein [Polyangiaceae bacterium]